MASTGFATFDTYRFIIDYTLSHKGNTPSMRQIAKGCGFSQDTSHAHVHVLIGMGLLEKIDNELCVARIAVVAPDNIYDLEPPNRVMPEIGTMKYIPLVRTMGKTSLARLGITVGEKINDQFANATYPDEWRFITSTDNGVIETYHLVDENKSPVATMRYDALNNLASMHFWR